MKTCVKCLSLLDTSKFYDKGRENRTASWCKDCFNQYCVDRWIRIKLETIERFGSKCKDCEQSYHYSVYEFHHLHPDKKEYTWTKMRLMSQIKRDVELTKCVMLCANCHRVRHAAALSC